MNEILSYVSTIMVATNTLSHSRKRLRPLVSHQLWFFCWNLRVSTGRHPVGHQLIFIFILFFFSQGVRSVLAFLFFFFSGRELGCVLHFNSILQSISSELPLSLSGNVTWKPGYPYNNVFVQLEIESSNRSLTQFKSWLCIPYNSIFSDRVSISSHMNILFIIFLSVSVRFWALPFLCCNLIV